MSSTIAEQSAPSRRSALFFVTLILLTAALAAAMRLPQLALRPMHVDEGVNALKFRDLYEHGTYVYDPHQFHGPALYYMALPVAWVQGAPSWLDLGESTYRLVTVFCGIALILLLLLLRGALPSTALVCAGALTANSPAMVFYSRYFIHEMPLTLFAFAAIITGWRFAQRRRIGSAVACGTSLGLMYATKETALILYAVMVLSLGFAFMWTRWQDGRRALEMSLEAGGLRTENLGLRQTGNLGLSPQSTVLSASAPLSPALRGEGRGEGPRDELRDSRGISSNLSPQPSPLRTGERAPERIRPRLFLAALIPASVVIILLYTAFFTHLRGLLDAVLMYRTYVNRAASDNVHTEAATYYLRILLYAKNGPLVWSEALIVVLAFIGSIAVIVEAIPRRYLPLARFLVLYTMILTAIFTVIPYKTPWNILTFLHGMILLAGLGAATLLRRIPTIPLKALTAAALIAAAVQLGAQAKRASVRWCADPRNPYVYAQTVPDAVKLADVVLAISRLHPDGNRMPVQVVTDNYWPLPWYLRRLERVGYLDYAPAHPGAPVILASTELAKLIEPHLHGPYTPFMRGLRPGVIMVVYVRTDLWEAYQRSKTHRER